MPTPKKVSPDVDNSTMASRKAERERQEAAGEIEPRKPYKPKMTFRAGLDEPTPLMVVTHVQN